MNITVPIYIKNSDLPNQAGKNTHLNLCHIFNQHVPDQTIGAQLVHGVWSIWIKDTRARDYLINKVKLIELEGRPIEIYDLYPTAKAIPNEKIVFKDLPPAVDDATIINYLNDQPGIIVKSGVIWARIRDDNNKLTSLYSGDRFVFVKGLFSPALPVTALLDYNRARIWHKSQEKACLRCRQIDHTTIQTNKCGAFTSDLNTVTIRSPQNPLCNYYKCNIKVFNMEFPSAEHAYQWRFMKYIRMDDHALEILDAESPTAAKETASRIPRFLHRDWHQIKLTVMRDILIAKADYCPAFKSTLIDSGVKDLVECTQDLFWASGLAPRLTATTKPSFYPGSNMLGNILDSVRRDLIKGAVITSITETDMPRPQHPKQLPSDTLPTEPLNTSLLPSEPLSSEPLSSAPIPSEPLPSEQLPSAPLPAEPLPSEPLPSEPLPSEPLPSEQFPSEQRRSNQ